MKVGSVWNSLVLMLLGLTQQLQQEALDHLALKILTDFDHQWPLKKLIFLMKNILSQLH